MNGAPLRKFCGRGFTLVELLVSFAVLALILALLFQISGGTFQATSRLNAQMTSSQQARAFFDAFEADWAGCVTRHGLSVFVRQSTSTASPEIVLLTQRRSPSGTTGSRYLAAAFQSSGTDLLRKIAAVPWSETDLVSSTLAAASAGSDSIVATGVVRLEVVFVLDDGRIVALPAGSSSLPSWLTHSIHGQTLSEGFAALQLANGARNPASLRVRAIIIGLATLDDKNLRLPGAETIGAKLPPPQNGETPLALWSQILAGGNAMAGVPAPAVAALRISQRTYFVP